MTLPFPFLLVTLPSCLNLCSALLAVLVPLGFQAKGMVGVLGTI